MPRSSKILVLPVEKLAVEARSSQPAFSLEHQRLLANYCHYARATYVKRMQCPYRSHRDRTLPPWDNGPDISAQAPIPTVWAH
jgi:hypothetical protein